MREPPTQVVAIVDPAAPAAVDLLLVLVTLGSEPEGVTADLLGPVVLDLQTGEGAQAVLAESGHSARVPLRAS